MKIYQTENGPVTLYSCNDFSLFIYKSYSIYKSEYWKYILMSVLCEMC
jgi:hypothetical protein